LTFIPEEYKCIKKKTNVILRNIFTEKATNLRTLTVLAWPYKEFYHRRNLPKTC